MIISSSMTHVAVKGENEDKKEVLTCEVSRAYFYEPAIRPAYVKVNDGDWDEGDEGMCGKCDASMHGTRYAALNWHHHYRAHIQDIGFIQGRASPRIFQHPERDIKLFVHGDDYVLSGYHGELKWFEKEMEKKYECKTDLLGPDVDDDKHVKMFNRILAWQPKQGRDMISYEAGPCHAEVAEQLRLQNAMPLSTFFAKVETSQGQYVESEFSSQKMQFSINPSSLERST